MPSSKAACAARTGELEASATRLLESEERRSLALRPADGIVGLGCGDRQADMG